MSSIKPPPNASSRPSFELKGVDLSSFPDIEERNGEYVVHTHCCLPGGDQIPVVIRRSGTEWVVSDDGHAYSVLLSLGIDLSSRRSRELAQELSREAGLSFIDASFVALAGGSHQLPAAILWVANTAQAWANAVATRHQHVANRELKRRVVEECQNVFGAARTIIDFEALGRSTKRYDVTAAVRLAPGKMLLLEPVSHNPVSISFAHTKLSDLGAANPSWVREVVVQSRDDWASDDLSLLASAVTSVQDIDNLAKHLALVSAA